MSPPGEPYWLKIAGLVRESWPKKRAGLSVCDDLDNDERDLANLHPGDVSLLLRRMEGLRLDPVEFSRAEPVLFCDFQRRCAACESTEQCTLGLADEFADPAWQDWRDYCPNSTMLCVLSTLRGSYSVATAQS